MDKKIITRFAPSPTGFLHVGGLRTALYAYLFAKKQAGDFLIRIEDTDQSRLVEGAVDNVLTTLKIFNLNWDNDPPPHQSNRLAEYQQAAEQLVAQGDAYAEPPSEEYPGRAIRFRLAKIGTTEFNDVIRGKVSFKNEILKDPIILKSDGFPTYHLAVVVDDHAMGITHVIRGEEWLPSTPIHLQIYARLNFIPPVFGHLPLLLNPDRAKLSKRQGDVAVEDYLQKGYLPEALLNFVLLLGWNPGTAQEIFSLDEMLQLFSLENVNKSGAVFDVQKLDWLNSVYIRKLNRSEFAEACLPFFHAAGIQITAREIEPIVATEQERIKKLSEIVEATQFFFERPQYESGLLLWKKMTGREVENNLKLLITFLEDHNGWNSDELESAIVGLLKDKQMSMGEMLWPMRAALSGRRASPGPFEIAAALGKAETLVRLKEAVNRLEE